jgi:hypothetical protein
MECIYCHRRFKPQRNDALTCSGRCRVAYGRWLREITPPWPTPPAGGFQLVSIDLPLGWEAYSPTGEGRSPQSHYPVLEPRVCIRLLRPMLAPTSRGGVMAKDSISAWWVYGPRREPYIGPRFAVALGQITRACGFTVTTELLTWIKVEEIGAGAFAGWVKPGGYGTGKTTRKGVENMLGARHGAGLPVCDHGVDQRVFAVKGEHSEKPDEAYHRLERLYGDVRRLELFATKERPGWETWGHIEGSDFVGRLRERGLLP